MAPQLRENISSSKEPAVPPQPITTQDLGFIGPFRANDSHLSSTGSTGSSSTNESSEWSSSSAPSSNKISFSPPLYPAQQQQQHSATDSTMSASAGTREMTKPPVQAQRKSSRAKTSTLIYVNGHAIKKENNYVVKGMEYVYGGAVGQEQPTKRKAAPKAGPKPPPKPRAITAQEAERRDKKAEIEKAIRDKAPRRNQFLKEHLSVLTPFIEPKVAQAIQQATVNGASSVDSVPMYMQPDSITGDMRSYQLSGLNWMAKMYSNNMSCILGDEMGLGKTLQTIALVCHLKEVYNKTGPSLIICPLSVLYSWCSEIAKWAPSLKYLRFHSSNPESLDVSNLAEYDMVITTYEMAKAPSLRTLWFRQQFNLLVLDEGHRIKSQDTQISQAVRKIHSETRLILTGTPLANNLVELYSLLSFLAPDIFTTSQPFAEAFDLTLNVVDPVRLEQAHHLLKAFMLRRMKVEVEKLMPKKIETKVICPLSNMQIWWYKSILLKDINLLTRGDEKVNSKHLSNLIMQLRKCCIHPYLFPDAEDIESTSMEDLIGASGKLAVLDKLLRSLYEKGHRVVLFSQFTSVLDILEDYSNMRGWNYVRFDGGTARAKRNYVVNSFNAPNSDKFLFLMSTRAGGMGLNLQTADTCVLFDSDWNPQPDIQAMARVHRLGQTKTVHVYRLVTQGTVEERMVERAEKKLYLDRMVNRDCAESESTTMDEENDSGKLMQTLKFGCNAVFGQSSDKNRLPTDEDIAIITDRSRTEDFSSGNLKGGVDASADDYDATKKFTATTDFNGIDFKKIREEYKNAKVENLGQISDIWKKRQRKNRIKMVDAEGSGYGAKAVPVLNSNDYDLQSGERSVFQQELRGRSNNDKSKKAGPKFEMQDFCQVCGDGGYLLGCPRCPISLHLECSGVGHQKYFMWCSHHHCAVCEKSAASVGGFMFPCSCCSNAFCEDHLPADARFLEPCERIEKLGFDYKNGVYIHCSKQCEEVAITEFGYQVPGKKASSPCPAALDLSIKFGGKVDESIEAPEEVIITAKRRRNVVNYAQGGSTSPNRLNQATSNVPSDWFDDREGKRWKENEEPWDPSAADDDDIECLGTVPPNSIAHVAKMPPSVKTTHAPHHPSQESASRDYEVALPLTKDGFLISLKQHHKDGSTRFVGYRRDAKGQPGPAELEGLFQRKGDQIVAVNGQSCEGKPFTTVLDMLRRSQTVGKEHTILRMRTRK